MPNRRLWRRITLAFAAFGFVLTSVLGFGVVAVLKSIEDQMLDNTLRAELAYFRLNQKVGRTIETFTSRTTVIHVSPLNTDGHVPPYLRDLPTGSHDLVNNGRNFRVLVEQEGNRRFIVQFDDTDIRQRELQFVRLVWVLSIATLLSALTVGWLIARRVSAPLARLAHDVMSLDSTPGKNIEVSEFEDNEIGFLAERIHDYHDQLNQVLIREREFTGNVSHELRTPITNISLAAEVLASNPRLSDKDRERVARIQRATREMTELVETFLVLARTQGAERNSNSECDVNMIAKDVIEQQKVWLYEKPVEVVLTESAELRVNAPNRVVSVLIANLVRNAFRYTEQGTVSITLHADHLVVEDTGPGINRTTQERMFEPYARGIDTDPDGFGLGLAIVHRICEHYDWSIRLESTGKTGSRFVVHFF